MSNKPRQGSLIVISAPSGAGKTSLATRLLDEVKRVRFSISHTTRLPRSGEKDGVDYFFVSDDQFRKMIDDDQFLEYANVYGKYYYGTSRGKVDSWLNEGYDVLLDIDVQGAMQVKKNRPGTLMVFVFPPSFRVLEERLRGRGLDDPGEIERRLEAAAQEIAHYSEYEYAIVNDDFERSILELKFIVLAGRCRTTRNLEQAESICRTFETGLRAVAGGEGRQD